MRFSFYRITCEGVNIKELEGWTSEDIVDRYMSTVLCRPIPLLAFFYFVSCFSLFLPAFHFLVLPPLPSPPSVCWQLSLRSMILVHLILVFIVVSSSNYAERSPSHPSFLFLASFCRPCVRHDQQTPSSVLIAGLVRKRLPLAFPPRTRETRIIRALRCWNSIFNCSIRA